LIQTGQALAYFISSILFGLSWQVLGANTAIAIAAGAALVAIGVTMALLAPRKEAAR
jgi:hypothetical protein